jgi:hypothetical protein
LRLTRVLSPPAFFALLERFERIIFRGVVQIQLSL